MKSHLISCLLSLVAGGLYALTYPSFMGGGWLPLLFIALPLFLWNLERTQGLKQGLFHVLCYNVGLNLVGFYWIPATLREFGQLPYFVSILLGLLFSFILQPHWWGYVIWKKFRPTSLNWNSERGILLTAFILTLLERYFPQQFPIYAGSPWLHLAPYLGLAPILGVIAYSFMSYWIGLEVVMQIRLKVMRPLVWIVLAIFVGMNAYLKLEIPTDSPKLPVRIVQANIGNFMKVASEHGDTNSFDSINDTYRNLSWTNNGFKPELILWPETAYSDTFYGTGSELPGIFTDIMNTTQAEMLIGGYEQDMSKDLKDYYETVWNSSLLLSEGKVKSSYHKNILIPFGETLPFGPLNRSIVNMVPAVSLFARGNGTPLMETKKGYRFVTPICYEILESNYMRSLLNEHSQNSFIANHTNDSWYGNTAEPYQHLFLSKWRALEFQMPIIRSTNTGVSSVIFPDGSESKQLGMGEKNLLDVIVPLSNGKSTTYQDYGAIPMFLIFLALLGIIFVREKSGSRP
jgi:apolipoprotein N-acyltransferase